MSTDVWANNPVDQAGWSTEGGSTRRAYRLRNVKGTDAVRRTDTTWLWTELSDSPVICIDASPRCSR